MLFRFHLHQYVFLAQDYRESNRYKVCINMTWTYFIVYDLNSMSDSPLLCAHMGMCLEVHAKIRFEFSQTTSLSELDWLVVPHSNI